MNNKTIKIVDEHNIDRVGNILFGALVNGSEYVVYSIERDEDNSNIFISKIIKNLDGTYNLLDIDDFSVKNKLGEMVKSLVTLAVNNNGNKLEKATVTLNDGSTVEIIGCMFNKEQRINVTKTYITTVSKKVVDLTEDYFILPHASEETVKFEDVFPAVNNPFEDESVETPDDTLTVDNVVPPVSKPDVVAESVMPGITVPKDVDDVVGDSKKVNDNLVTPPVIDTTVNPVPNFIPQTEVEDKSGVVVNSNENNDSVRDEVVGVLESLTDPQADIPSVASVNAVPLTMDASKEDNLNAALNEVAESTNITVSPENMETVREFGVDTPKTDMHVNNPVPNEGQQKSMGFANSKFFSVIAILLFLGACCFLGYEIFNYFDLVK